MPPGLVSELCCTSWPVTQSAPGLCDLLGDGDGLAELVCDRDGDGLGDREFDGLGLLLAEVLELLVLLGLEEPVGLREAVWLGLLDGLGVLDGLGLLDGLGVFDGLGLFDGLALAWICGAEVAGIASWLADSTAKEPWPHGDAIGRAEDATAGAIAKPDARKDPATRQMAKRPARMTPTGTGALRSSG